MPGFNTEGKFCQRLADGKRAAWDAAPYGEAGKYIKKAGERTCRKCGELAAGLCEYIFDEQSARKTEEVANA